MTEDTHNLVDRSERRPAAVAPRGSTFKCVTAVSAVLGYITLLVVTILHHERWSDEAQAWLLARDLGINRLMYQMHAEGTPPLWHFILWIANHWLHLPYAAISWIGAACAVAGVIWFLRFCPFPWWARLAFPFTYFMLYQYAAIARQYVLLPLFAFAAARSYHDADRKPWPFVTSLCLLSLLSPHSAVLGCSLAIVRAFDLVRFRSKDEHHLPRVVVSAGIVYSLVLLFAFLSVWPPVNTMMAMRKATHGAVNNDLFGLRILLPAISSAFLGSAAASLFLIAIMASWCYFRRRLLLFLLPLGMCLGLLMVYYSAWHSGLLTVALVTVLWISWPSREEMGKMQKWIPRAAMSVFMVLCAVQIWWSAETIRMETRLPYSGSLDAVQFLKKAGARSDNTCGLDYAVTAIQPYFAHSAFENLPHSYWDWSRMASTFCGDADEWVVVGLPGRVPESITIRWYDARMNDMQFVRVHTSPGMAIFEGRIQESGTILIYRKVR